MTVALELTPDQIARANEIANLEGVEVSDLLADRAMSALNVEVREREVVRGRMAKADRGEFLTEEEMEQRIAKMLRPR